MAEGTPSPSGAPAVSAPNEQAEEQKQVQGGQEAAGGDAPGAKPGEAAPAEPKVRQRKAKLPGVVSRDDGEDIFPDLGFKRRDGKKVSREEAEAEAAAEMREEMGFEIPAPPKREGEQPKAPEEQKAPEKIKFNGKEYGSMQEIEQEHKSLQGMFKPMQERLSKAEQAAQLAMQRANEWMEYAKSAQQQAPPPQQTQPQPTDMQSAEQELQAVLAGIDGDRFETLARERGLPLAGRYLAAQVLATVHDKMLPALTEQILKQVQEQYAPVTQSVELQQQTQQAGSLIENVSQFRNNDGSLAFPELNDPDEMSEVAELWSSNPEAKLTPQSLIQAIAMYRLYRNSRGTQPTSTPQPVQVTPPPNMVQRPESLEDGGVRVTPASPRNNGDGDGSRFARALDDAALVDRTLGFAVRRRR